MAYITGVIRYIVHDWMDMETQVVFYWWNVWYNLWTVIIKGDLLKVLRPTMRILVLTEQMVNRSSKHFSQNGSCTNCGIKLKTGSSILSKKSPSNTKWYCLICAKKKNMI